MNITEMREKRAKLWNTMEGFLDTHRNDMGVLSADDDQTYCNMESELDSLTNEIHRMERREAHEAELDKAMKKGDPEKIDKRKNKLAESRKELQEALDQLDK